MTEEEFVKWFKGFSEGVHHYNISPKQWDYVKDQLKKVGVKKESEYTIDSNFWVTTTT